MAQWALLTCLSRVQLFIPLIHPRIGHWRPYHDVRDAMGDIAGPHTRRIQPSHRSYHEFQWQPSRAMGKAVEYHNSLVAPRLQLYGCILISFCGMRSILPLYFTAPMYPLYQRRTIPKLYIQRSSLRFFLSLLSSLHQLEYISSAWSICIRLTPVLS